MLRAAKGRSLTGPALVALAVLVGACAPEPEIRVGKSPLAADSRVSAAPSAAEARVGANRPTARDLRQAARDVGPEMLQRWRRFWRKPAAEVTVDPNGNLASLTPPQKPAHGFQYTPVDLEQSYDPPDLGIGNVSTTYQYNLDKQLELVSRPDGASIDPAYEATTGRLASVAIPGASYGYGYDPTTGKLVSITGPDATLSYTWDGFLLKTAIWTGGVAGAVERVYDNDFRVSEIKLNGGSLAVYGYDDDSLLTQAGALTIGRDPQNGLVTGSTLGIVTDTVGYNAFAEPTAYAAQAGATALYSSDLTDRDELGRIQTKVETVEGVTSTWVYTYDLAGRLETVTRDTVPVATYTYDANGNRLSVAPGDPTPIAAYDAHDRLLSYGSTTYTYSAHGDLQSKTTGTDTTTYVYDALGNLRSVTLPDGILVEYLLDGRGRRIAKKANGSTIQKWLWLDKLRPIAELDGAGNLVSTFVYTTGVTSPAYIVRGGATYRIVKDHLGSPRLVVDTATGAIAQRIDYDTWGNVTRDTNPGFQPFGFAGGLYDSDTKLVRFGARDYDSAVGRWTVKDPSRFTGRDTNLYRYAFGDPLNFVDSTGRQAAAVAIGWGAVAVGWGLRWAARKLAAWLAAKLLELFSKPKDKDDPENPDNARAFPSESTPGDPNRCTGGPEEDPPLRPLHPESSLRRSSVDYWRNKGSEEIVESLAPGQREPLTVRPDGTVMQGNTRIHELMRRGVDVNQLPRVPYP